MIGSLLVLRCCKNSNKICPGRSQPVRTPFISQLHLKSAQNIRKKRFMALNRRKTIDLRTFLCLSSQESWHKLEIRRRHFMSSETPCGPFEGSVLRRVRIRRFEKYSILLDGLMGVLYLTHSLSLSDFHK